MALLGENFLKILLRFFRGLGKTFHQQAVRVAGHFWKVDIHLPCLQSLWTVKTGTILQAGFSEMCTHSPCLLIMWLQSMNSRSAKKRECIYTCPACYYVTVLNGIMSKQGIFKNGDPLALLARLQTIAKIKSRNPLCYFGIRLIYLYIHNFQWHNSRVAKIISGNYNKIDK